MSALYSEQNQMQPRCGETTAGDSGGPVFTCGVEIGIARLGPDGSERVRFHANFCLCRYKLYIGLPAPCLKTQAMCCQTTYHYYRLQRAYKCVS